MAWYSSITAAWAQVIITFVTAAIVAWYTLETYWLRKETVRSNKISTRPIVLPIFKPLSLDTMGFFLKNSGNGCATNIRVEPIRVELSPEVEEFMGRSEIRFESLEYLEVGEERQVNYAVFVEGAKTNRSPFDAWFFPQFPSTHKMAVRIIFEDIERQSYEIIVTILPENDRAKLPRKVEIGTIKESRRIN